MFILIFIRLFLFWAHPSDSAKDMIGVPGPLNFNKTSFELTLTEHPKSNVYIQMYFAKGENFDNYNQMLTLYLIDTTMVLEESMNRKLKELKDRKKSDLNCFYHITEDKDGKYFIIDYLTTETENRKLTSAEYNVFKYQTVQLANRTAILVYAYSWKSYDEESKQFINAINGFRNDFINEIISTKTPSVSL